MKLIEILLAALLITGCGVTGEPVSPEQPEPVIQEEALEITAFSFSHRGMSTEECYYYSVEQREEGVHLYTEELFSGGFIVDTIVEEPVMEQLNEIVERYRMDQWDGFNKSDSLVLDGSGFSLSISFADGKAVLASGNNAFPEGYADAEREICALFEDLIDRYGNCDPQILE